MTEQFFRDEFAALYSKCHLDLLRYVLTLLPNRHQAEDVVQETARLLLQKFDQYNPERPFDPWAQRFAYLEVLKFLKKQSVRGKFFPSNWWSDWPKNVWRRRNN